MLDDKVIIYDDSCPMCRLYTYWFVAWGFLKPENRIGFATAPVEITSNLDLVRGRHEIPLFDRRTKETIYGLKALTHILGNRWTWLNPFFESRIFFWMFFPLYQIITYNRRVIAGCRSCCGFDCAPDLNRFYRSVYLAIVGTMATGVSIALLAAATLPAKAAAIIIAAMASVGFLVVALKRISESPEVAWDYSGNYATTLLIVCFCFVPLALVPQMPSAAGLFVLLVGALLGMTELRRRSL